MVNKKSVNSIDQILKETKAKEIEYNILYNNRCKIGKKLNQISGEMSILCDKAKTLRDDVLQEIDNINSDCVGVDDD